MGSIAPQRPELTVRPWDLDPGDVILLDGAPFDVLSEPFTGVAGMSLFDSAELFWRVRVRPVADPVMVGYATWTARDDVLLAQPVMA